MNKEKYISLIIEKLNDVISESDALILDVWLSENEDNKLVYNDIEQIWADTKDIQPAKTSDKEKSWQIIQDEIAKTETKVIPMKRFSYMKIASVLVVLIASVYFINSFSNSNNLIIETTALNETKHIVLPDGSEIDLNENSKITYAKNFKKRNITLEGEAFFDVTKDEDKPFSVKTFDTETFVLGTSFNVNAYEKQNTEIALFTGKIKFVANNNSIILKPGEKISYDNQKKVLFETEKNSLNELAWKTKTLVFEDSKIVEVISDLEKYYHKKITIENIETTECVFTGTFKNKELKEALESIAFSYETEYTIVNNEIQFSNLSCQ